MANTSLLICRPLTAISVLTLTKKEVATKGFQESPKEHG